MSEQINYIDIAKDYGIPTAPEPLNSYENQLVKLQKNQDTFNKSWQESKDLYDQYRNDKMGLLTARRRLALLVTKAKQEGWLVDNQPV